MVVTFLFPPETVPYAFSTRGLLYNLRSVWSNIVNLQPMLGLEGNYSE
jgi:hypothetical protein